MTSNEYWEKRIANNIWKIYNTLEEKNRDLLEFYIDASKQIREELYTIAEKYSKDGLLSLADMHKQDRLARLNAKYEAIIKELGEQTEELATQNMKRGFEEAYKSTAIGMGDTDFAMPNKKLMNKLLSEPWRGDNFSSRLWQNQKRLAVALNSTLLSGLQQGKTVTEIANSLHNIVGNGFNNCHRIVRTESMHYLNSATLLRYNDAGIENVRVWAALDERTCEECSKYHNKIYGINEVPVLPFHPNCRCTIIPVFE